jgi:17beta-estradiol 17-dehydrogenase / very-long-chain 3-oxoacyl-CoA reductase
MSIVFWAVVAIVVYIVGMFVYQHFVYKKDYSAYKGEWAVVTGASYGIGKSIAFCLAARGINVYIIARSKDKLDQVAAEITSKYNVQVKVLVFDLLKKESIPEIEKQIKGAAILVNNAGGQLYELSFLPFLDYTAKDFDRTYQLNLWSTIDLTRVVLQNMIDKKRGIVLNVSSVASKIPYWMTAYASGKSAGNTFSQALHKEMAHTGVIVQGIIVGMVDTPLNDRYIKVSPEMVTADELAEATINQVGWFGYELIPHWKHDFFTTLLVCIPDWIRYRIIGATYKKLKPSIAHKIK